MNMMVVKRQRKTRLSAVRQLEITDHAEWLRLRRALWPECSDDMHVLEMRRFLDDPLRTEVFVHEKPDGRLGGFLEASIRDRVDDSFSRRVVYVDGWYVEPDLRDRTIGRQLLRAAEKWALGLGITELASDCTLDNLPAVQAHLASGFRETFRLVHFLKKIEGDSRR